MCLLYKVNCERLIKRGRFHGDAKLKRELHAMNGVVGKEIAVQIEGVVGGREEQAKKLRLLSKSET